MAKKKKKRKGRRKAGGAEVSPADGLTEGREPYGVPVDGPTGSGDASGLPVRPPRPSCLRGTLPKDPIFRVCFTTEVIRHVIEIPPNFKYHWADLPEPRPKQRRCCPVGDDWTEFDWDYDHSELPTTAAGWTSYRPMSLAHARAMAIELASGRGEINTEVTAEMAEYYKKHMHGGTQESLAGLDREPWEGAPSRSTNDVRAWPLIFDGTRVLRVADYDDGFALYGRRFDDHNAYRWRLPPFHEYDSVEECRRQLYDEGRIIDDFELYGDVPTQYITKEKVARPAAHCKSVDASLNGEAVGEQTGKST